MTTKTARPALFKYSILALPLAFAGLPLYIHAPDFYATQAGLSLATIGIIILCVRLLDAIQDPLIGYYSNKYAHHRPAIMTIAMTMMAVGFAMLFHPIKSIPLIWFTTSLILATTAFSILSINFNTLGSLWSQDTTEKTRITAWREGFGLLGLLVAAIIPTLVGLPATAIIFVGIISTTGLIFTRWNAAHSDIITDSEGAQEPLNFALIATPTNIRFFTIYLISMLASAIPAVLVIFFIRDLLDAEHLTGLFLLLYFIAGAAGMPLWQIIAKRTSKHTAWLISMALAVATFIWAYALGAGDIWQYAAICLLSGFALGAELALPPAILSDMIDTQKRRSQTSLFFSLLAFLNKAALALGSALAFLILGNAAFTPAADNTIDALHSLSIAYALIPCAIKIIAAILLWRAQPPKRTTS